MKETLSQSEVADALIDQRADSIKIAVTDNERAVLITVNGVEAAYTADEARELADALMCTSAQRWEENAGDAVGYIKDLADLVDGEITEEEIREKYNKFALNP